MIKDKFGIIILVLLFSLCSCTKNSLHIEGKNDYQIVVPANANTIEKKSAQQLQHYFFEMSATNLPVVVEDDYRGVNGIFIGKTNYAKALGINFSLLEENGYLYKREGSNLLIAGGSEKGVLYGVYDLLEFLGFRKYTSDYTYIPKKNSITFPPKDTTVIPKIKYRTTLYRDTEDPEYMDWHKLSTNESWGAFVHTIFSLVPPDKYFASHPEYYALRNGKRLPTQLCLSNPEVVDTLIANLGKKIKENPEAKYWSVSQADNDKYCLCDNCVQLDKKYGGDKSIHSGSMIYFVNQVAKAFPDKIISTLAYWYTREAPLNIKPEPNVNIMLCNIESARHKPVFETDPAFASDLKNWGQIANDILIWDYDVQFANLVSPFPNLHTIKPNLKFFTDNNVNAFFMQANGQTGGEMSELRAYLICKLLWNPDADDQAIMSDFLNGYYGKAAPYIQQYIDTIQYALQKSGQQLEIFGSPEEAKDTYLSENRMNLYNQLFDKAENAVAEDAELLRRVQIARLPIMYARIQISKSETDTPRSLFQHDNNGKVVATTEIKTIVNQFVERTKKQGVNLLRERSISPDEYLKSYNRIFRKIDENNSALSVNKKVIPVTQASSKYRNPECLTDGIFGSYESWRDVRFDNWIGYEGGHMDFILDLGTIMPLKSVNMDFYDAKDTWYQIFLPEYVTYAVSADGINYQEDVKILNPVDPNIPVRDSFPREVYVQSFQANMKDCKARYIKVHAHSILNCPTWHVRSGDPVTIFSDEIVVK
ncbi:DUF4838 domain-containing protein [Maribellus maritimus]|uniref:DUF4838 domain-containing protein n=1 Tax=Maribellus maritimus TaxID=2870838 RepID=UPI001EEC69E2|nr:DUF4838 domain-containing protein [Maribellus maritimus]MCG6189569.1 DUF4838 domain-containing protein [Maribellus maritimus]